MTRRTPGIDFFDEASFITPVTVVCPCSMTNENRARKRGERRFFMKEDISQIVKFKNNSQGDLGQYRTIGNLTNSYIPNLRDRADNSRKP